MISESINIWITAHELLLIAAGVALWATCIFFQMLGSAPRRTTRTPRPPSRLPDWIRSRSGLTRAIQTPDREL